MASRYNDYTMCNSYCVGDRTDWDWQRDAAHSGLCEKRNEAVAIMVKLLKAGVEPLNPLPEMDLEVARLLHLDPMLTAAVAGAGGENAVEAAKEPQAAEQERARLQAEADAEQAPAAAPVLPHRDETHRQHRHALDVGFGRWRAISLRRQETAARQKAAAEQEALGRREEELRRRERELSRRERDLSRRERDLNRDQPGSSRPSKRPR